MITSAKQERLLTNKSVMSEIISVLAGTWASMLSRPAERAESVPCKQEVITGLHLLSLLILPSICLLSLLGAISISDYNSVFHSSFHASSRWLFPAFIAGGGGMAFQCIYKRRFHIQGTRAPWACCVRLRWSTELHADICSALETTFHLLETHKSLKKNKKK